MDTKWQPCKYQFRNRPSSWSNIESHFLKRKRKFSEVNPYPGAGAITFTLTWPNDLKRGTLRGDGKSLRKNLFLFPTSYLCSLSLSLNFISSKAAHRCLSLNTYNIFIHYRIVLFMILLITLLGTCFDIFIVQYSNIPVSKLSTGKRCFVAFSIPRNFSSVWNTGNTTETSLGCLHGFRVLTIGWVVMGHTYALTNHQAFGRLKQKFDVNLFPCIPRIVYQKNNVMEFERSKVSHIEKELKSLKLDKTWQSKLN